MAEYIDKKKLIEILEQEVEEADDWKTAHEIANVAKYFPAADVRENVKGKWIESDPLDYYIFYKCSICRHSGNEAFDFCPNCGADMRGNYD